MVFNFLEQAVERINRIDPDDILTYSAFIVPKEMPKAGDVVGVDRGFYHHFGIYCGGDKIIHYSSETSDIGADNAIRKTSFKEFLRNSNFFFIVNFDNEQLPIAETIKRAHKRLGEQNYSLIFNNCEHFVHWCKTGIKNSPQVESVFEIVSQILSD